jgi:hypothetical protein
MKDLLDAFRADDVSVGNRRQFFGFARSDEMFSVW